VVPNIQELESTLATVTGYPAQKGFTSYIRNKPVFDMYTMSGPVTSVTKHKFHYRIDTSGGQSGAGAWMYNNKAEVECFGTYVTGDREMGNGAIRIGENNFKMINMWKDKLKN
jgi:V8-like Glu-specific endopeptidase